MILSWKPEKWTLPRRLAGTARQYSNSAIAHETTIALQSGHSCPYLRCPYQANVMKTFEIHRRIPVVMALAPEFGFACFRHEEVQDAGRRRGHTREKQEVGPRAYVVNDAAGGRLA
jgi:hypothetical protein